ncbi:MAG: HAMP domain-containing sensor histidine kinase [Candidatus Brocadiia bacterium]|jgi:signal transduction histidine kinase
MSVPRNILVLSSSIEQMEPALEALAKRGVATKCVTECYRFVAAFALAKPDIAIVDAEGFRKQDLEMLRVLRDIRPQSGIIVLVNPDQRDIAAGVFCQGADFYLLKPVDRLELLEAVSRVGLGHETPDSEATDANRVQVFSRFAAGIAEKINTPLAVVSGWLQLLGHDYAADPSLVDKLNLMKEETDRIADTTRQLLAFAAQTPPRNERVDLSQLLAELGRLYAARCREKGVLVATDIPDDLPPVLGDETQLRQALDAILQHTEAALTERCKLEIVSRPRADGVEIVFRDNGPPIPPDRVKGLFDPFAPTRISDSKGLGLAIAHGMIQNHGGKIQAMSDSSPMTQFTVWLPCPK